MWLKHNTFHRGYQSPWKYLTIYTTPQHKKHSFFSNTTAIMGYPVYLTVALVVTAAVLGVFIQATLFINSEAEEHAIIQEIHKIATEAQNMYEYADEGTRVTVHLDLPSSLSFAVFGDVPLDGCTQPTTLTRTLEETLYTSNHYYYIMNNGKMQMFHLPARFCGSTKDSIFLLEPGGYDLTLELVKLEGETFVQIT